MLGLIAEVGLMGSVVPVMMFAGLSFIVMGVFNSRRPSGFPPGPATLPFVGNIKGECSKKMLVTFDLKYL